MSTDTERKGGSYMVDEKGELVLLHRTQEAPPRATNENEPASAGFFSPEASEVSQPAAPTATAVADPSTTEKE